MSATHVFARWGDSWYPAFRTRDGERGAVWVRFVPAEGLPKGLKLMLPDQWRHNRPALTTYTAPTTLAVGRRSET